MVIYDERASGEMGWRFVNAGERYRRLQNVSEEDQLTVLGLFKQATMGDCEVGEAENNHFGEIENKHRNEWLKHKGMDFVDAMYKYIDLTGELAKIYKEAEPSEKKGEKETAKPNGKK